jgi:hypothetical protein
MNGALEGAGTAPFGWRCCERGDGRATGGGDARGDRAARRAGVRLRDLALAKGLCRKSASIRLWERSSRSAPEHIYKPRLGHNDILVLLLA